MSSRERVAHCFAVSQAGSYEILALIPLRVLAQRWPWNSFLMYLCIELGWYNHKMRRGPEASVSFLILHQQKERQVAPSK
jgi:hypothetical protein